MRRHRMMIGRQMRCNSRHDLRQPTCHATIAIREFWQASRMTSSLAVVAGPGIGRGDARWFEASGTSDFSAAHVASLSDLDTFWSWAWDECGVVGDRGSRAAVGPTTLQPRRSFLTHTSTSSRHCWSVSQSPEVLVGIDEAGSRRSWTRRELRSDVASVAAHMQRAGVGPDDRVAAWAPNVPEVVIWALAALSIGAVVSTASPILHPRG